MFLLKAWRTAAFGIYGFRDFTRQGFQEHSKNFRQEDMQVQMEGKNCIVTGANSGIGYAVAEGLASRGATVYMVCRSKERGEAALSKIQLSTSNPNVYLEVCDLSSMADIKSFASRFSSMDKPVHVLVWCPPDIKNPECQNTMNCAYGRFLLRRSFSEECCCLVDAWSLWKELYFLTYG